MDEGLLLNDVENNNDSVDYYALLTEMQEINKGINRLHSSQEELTQYIISRDKQSDQEKANEKKIQEEQKAIDKEAAEQQEAEQQEAKLQSEEQQEQQTETYTELLTDIRDEIRLSNQLTAGSFMFYGIICGILLFKILWDKLT